MGYPQTTPNELVPSPSSGVSSSSRLQYIWHVAQKILFSLLRSSGVCKYQQAFSAVLSLRLEQVDTMHCGQLSASMVHPFSLQNAALHSADAPGECRREQGDGRGRGLWGMGRQEMRTGAGGSHSNDVMSPGLMPVPMPFK